MQLVALRLRGVARSPGDALNAGNARRDDDSA